MRESAEKMFWKTAELVDKLIFFLDVESVSRLAEAHQLTAQLLNQGTSTWEKLVKRSCPYYEHAKLPVGVGSWGDSYRDWVVERVSRQETNICHLTRILRKMENPKLPMLELLHVICTRFPPVIFRPGLDNGRPMAFHLSCSCNSSHSVSHLGFLLLEKVESTLRSGEQEVET